MSWFTYRGGHRPEQVIKDWNAPLPDRGEWRLEALYAWERRLRGYDLYAEPVELEPAFVPFRPDADAATGGWDAVPQPPDGRGDEHLSYLSLRLPSAQKVIPAHVGEFLSGLRGLRHPASLEIVANGQAVHYQLACVPSDVALLSAACGACFPLGFLQTGPDILLRSLVALEDRGPVSQIIEFGLQHPAYLPLRLFETFAADPQSALLAPLGSLETDEVAGLQVMATPARAGWAGSLSLLVGQFDGVTERAHPGTLENELQRALRHKLATPLWAVAVRAFAATARRGGETDRLLVERTFDLCRRVGEALEATQGANRLLALDDEGYGTLDQFRDLLDRRTRRAGMVISQGELAGLWHPPTERASHPRLVRHDPAYRDLPEYLQEPPGAVMGYLAPPPHALPCEAPDLVRWPDAMRNRHLYMLGATRMGKSTLMLNLIAQDLLAGRGLCLIDPHGDLALDVLSRVPMDREQDTLYLDLSDAAHPPAIGLLEAADDWERTLLVSDLLAILQRIFRSSWGDRLEHILRHALLTLLAADTSPLGSAVTLRDIRPLLASKPYRDRLLERGADADLKTFWQAEFPGYPSSAFAPVYNKLGLLLSSPIVRNIVGGAENRLDMGGLIQDRQVVIVNLAQSLIGEDNAHFLGALLVSKVQLAAMHGLRLGKAERTPFTLYVDEFQNFVVSSFEKILSEAGKAGLSLAMANQFLEQLGDGLATAIRSNAGTLVSFRVSAQSGRALEGEFGGLFGADTLSDLERGRAVARIGRAGDSFLVRTFPPVEPGTMGATPDGSESIRRQTHGRACRDRAEVEAELRTSDEALQALLREAAEEEKRARDARDAAKGRSAKRAGGPKGRGLEEDPDLPEGAQMPAPPGTAGPPADAAGAAGRNADSVRKSSLRRNVPVESPEAEGPAAPLFFGLPDRLEEDGGEA